MLSTRMHAMRFNLRRIQVVVVVAIIEMVVFLFFEFCFLIFVLSRFLGGSSAFCLDAFASWFFCVHDSCHVIRSQFSQGTLATR